MSFTQVPPLPPTKTTGVISPDTVAKRTAFLARFLHTIASTPLFLRSPFLTSFLKETSKDHFRKVKKSAKRVKRAEKVQEHSTIGDSVPCSASLMTDHFNVISDFLSSSEHLKRKLKRQSESLISSLVAVSKEIESFAELLKSISELQDVATRTDTLSWNYGSFATAMFQWSKWEMEIAEICKEKLNLFFKYRYMEVKELKEILKERENRLQSFVKASEKLEAKKTKLWAQGDVSKWNLSASDLLDIPGLRSDKAQAFARMLPSETLQVQGLQDSYGYCNYLAKGEVYRMISYCNEQEKTHFAEVSLLMEQCLQSLALEWRTLSSSLSSSH